MTVLTQTHSSCRPVNRRRISLPGLMDLYRQRRALASLSAAQLDDLGLTQSEARAESRRPFWDIPVERRICG